MGPESGVWPATDNSLLIPYDGPVGAAALGLSGIMDLPPMQTLELSSGEGEQRKLAVLGLPWDTSEETLRVYFSQFGALEHAEVMKDRYSGKSRGFGFVTFVEAEGAQRALLTDHSIDGRRCEAKIALPKGEPSPPRTTRIFVARVPPSVSEPQFRAYFETFGKLQDAYMPRDHSKQGYRGIGFVTFASPESVEKVMQVKHWMHGHEIAIDRATPKEEPAGMKNAVFTRPPLPNNGGQRRSFDNGAGIIGPGLTSVIHHMNPGLTTIGEGQVSFPTMRSMSEDRELDAMHHSLAQQQQQQQRSNGGPGYNQQEGGAGGNVNGEEYAGMSVGAMRAGQALGLSMGGLSLQSNNASAVHAAATSAALHSLAKAQSAAAQQQQQQQQAQQQHLGTDTSGFGPGALASLSAMQQMGGSAGMHTMSSDLSATFPYSGMGQVKGMLSDAAAVHQLMVAAAVGRHSLDAAMKRMENPAIATARAGPRIFVGKLTKDTSEGDVKEYFMRFGYVMDVYLPKAKDNKAEHRGFGFVTFETEAAIQRVVSNGAHRLRGSTIAIDIAMPKVEDELGADSGPATRRSFDSVAPGPNGYTVQQQQQQAAGGFAGGPLNGMPMMMAQRM